MWAPLVAIADLAGGDWPALARTAASVFTAEADEDAIDESLSVRLLADLRDVFDGHSEMSSADLVAGLRRVASAPWDAFDFKQRDLARWLHPSGCKPDRIRPDGTQVRGYRLEDLQDSFDRYIPASLSDSAGPSQSVTSVTETAVTDCDAPPSTGRELDDLGAWTSDITPSTNGMHA